MVNNIIIQAKNIVKKYRRGSEEVTAVNNISIDIKKGEFVSFIGPSGSGKTTLINLSPYGLKKPTTQSKPVCKEQSKLPIQSSCP